MWKTKAGGGRGFCGDSIIYIPVLGGSVRAAFVKKYDMVNFVMKIDFISVAE